MSARALQRLVAAAIFVAVLPAVACGDDDDDASPTPRAASPVATQASLPTPPGSPQPTRAQSPVAVPTAGSELPPALLNAVEGWVRGRDGELIGECAPEPPSGEGNDPAVQDWCYLNPVVSADTATINVGFPLSDYVFTLTLEQQADGAYVVVEATQNM